MGIFSLYYLWITYFSVALLTELVGTSPSFVCTQAQQSSINGSFVAIFGCDNDMDTFSLTNDGLHQSWSVKLNNARETYWIFVSFGSAEYEINIETTGGPWPLVHQCLPEGSKLKSLQRLVKCEDPDYFIRKENNITIRRKGNGQLKIFEVQPIEFSRLSQSMVLNSTDSNAVDGDMNTYFHSIENSQASWFLRLDKYYVMKWILLSVRRGYYEAHVKDGNTETSSSTLCQNFSFTGTDQLKKNHKALECFREMTGNTIIIKRTDNGPMRLFEVYPIICPEKHYGPNCAKCKAGCISCSPITGMCYQCHSTFYGDHCQSRCPRDCLNSICKQSTGVCEECYGAFYGDYCQHACPVNCLNSICNPKTGKCERCNGAFYGDFCNNTCPANCVDSTCSQRTGVCERCNGAFYGDLCQYRCPVNCFSSTCHQANGTCDTCKKGYHGLNCDLPITTEMYSERTPENCGHSCITCNPVLQMCLFCTRHQMLNRCQYKCNEICFGHDCHGVEENCTRKVTGKNDYLDCSKICSVQVS